jgi:hypothetical protein
MSSIHFQIQTGSYPKRRKLARAYCAAAKPKATHWYERVCAQRRYSMGLPQLASNPATVAEQKLDRAGYGALVRAAQTNDPESTEATTVSASNDLSLSRGSESSILSFWTPMDPRSQLSLKERFQLAWSAARPWREWASWQALAPPPSWLDWSARARMNLELYIWNYVFVLFASFIVTGVFYPWSALSMGAWFLLALYLGAHSVATNSEADSSLSARMISGSPLYMRYVLLGGLLILLLFMTEAVALALTSASIAFAVVLLHAAFHDPAEAVPSLNIEYIAAP